MIPPFTMLDPETGEVITQYSPGTVGVWTLDGEEGTYEGFAQGFIPHALSENTSYPNLPAGLTSKGKGEEFWSYPSEGHAGVQVEMTFLTATSPDQFDPDKDEAAAHWSEFRGTLDPTLSRNTFKVKYSRFIYSGGDTPLHVPRSNAATVFPSLKLQVKGETTVAAWVIRELVGVSARRSIAEHWVVNGDWQAGRFYDVRASNADIEDLMVELKKSRHTYWYMTL